MADVTLDLSQPNSDPRVLQKMHDNGDNTFSIATHDIDMLSELQGMNPMSSTIFDTILVTYTDATKATISKVEWKLGAAVVKTLTPTFGTNTDTWVKS